jgi:hypothetical protein
MKRTHLLMLSLIVIVCVLAIRWRTFQAHPEPTPVTAVGVEAPVPLKPTAPARRDPPIQPAGDPGDATALAARARPDVSNDSVLEDRAHQQQLAPEADARWQHAVDGPGYTANDLDVSVRELFRRIDLEPRYAEGGRIEGLVITGMPPDHPFAQLGFRSGDRIDRIQGVALRDPADIPSLLAHLGPNFDLCVNRQGEALCGELHLE